MRYKKTGLYLLFLLTCVVFFLELTAKFGLLKSSYYQSLQKAQALKGSPRLMILGDSFSLDVPDSWANLLKSDFEKAQGSILNTAQAGTGPLAYWDAAQTLAATYMPNVILLNYYVGNDLTDTVHTVKSTRGLKGIIKSAMKWFALGHVLLDVRARWMTRQRLRALQAEIPTSGSAQESSHKPLNPFLWEMAKNRPDYLTDNLLMNKDHLDVAWNLNQEAILKVRDLAKSIDAKFMVAIFPRSLQIDKSHVSFFEQIGFNVPKNLIQTRVSQSRFAEFCQRQDLTCIDLLPVFRKHRPAQGYLLNDDHWNKVGNNIAYDVIKAHLNVETGAGSIMEIYSDLSPFCEDCILMGL